MDSCAPPTRPPTKHSVKGRQADAAHATSALPMGQDAQDARRWAGIGIASGQHSRVRRMRPVIALHRPRLTRTVPWKPLHGAPSFTRLTSLTTEALNWMHASTCRSCLSACASHGQCSPTTPALNQAVQWRKNTVGVCLSSTKWKQGTQRIILCNGKTGARGSQHNPQPAIHNPAHPFSCRLVPPHLHNLEANLEAPPGVCIDDPHMPGIS